MKPRSRLLPAVAVPVLVAAYFAVEHRAGLADAGRILGGAGEGPMVLLSPTFTLDRLYGSMQGPYANQEGIRLAPADPEETVWVTGIETEVLDRDGATPISPEFFCHANLTLSLEDNTPEAHNAAFGGRTHLDWRLFTLVPGRLSLHLPEGFGIPVQGGEPLDYLAMSLNQNVADRTVHARFRTRIAWVRGAEAPLAMKPLFRRALYGYEPLGGGAGAVACAGGSHPGQACGPFLGTAASEHAFVAGLGKAKAIHWMIPPGRYESRTPVDDQMGLPFDTTVHYVTAHLHPYGVSLGLRDVSAGEDLFVLRSEDFADRVGVARMEELAIPEGVLLRRDHRYELITIYDNPTSKNIDAMAILYLYLLDRPSGV
jgi:hypothetical protein